MPVHFENDFVLYCFFYVVYFISLTVFQCICNIRVLGMRSFGKFFIDYNSLVSPAGFFGTSFVMCFSLNFSLAIPLG